LSDDQGEKSQGDERLEETAAGGGFHTLASLVPRARAMTARANARSSSSAMG
jgi:hypothetical protein